MGLYRLFYKISPVLYENRIAFNDLYSAEETIQNQFLRLQFLIVTMLVLISNKGVQGGAKLKYIIFYIFFFMGFTDFHLC